MASSKCTRASRSCSPNSPWCLRYRGFRRLGTCGPEQQTLHFRHLLHVVKQPPLHWRGIGGWRAWASREYPLPHYGNDVRRVRRFIHQPTPRWHRQKVLLLGNHVVPSRRKVYPKVRQMRRLPHRGLTVSGALSKEPNTLAETCSRKSDMVSR